MSENAQRRSEGRAHRRSVTRDRKPDEQQGEDGGMHEAVRAAAAAAAVGAAVGAVRTLVSRGADTGDAEDHNEPEPESQRQPGENEPGVDDADQQVTADDEQPPAEQPGREPRRPERTPKREAQPRHGAPTGTARSIVDTAREQLRELHGSDAESVTSLERIGDGWRVTCEVLEVERIPSSTDVLATYVVELDDDARLLSFERVRRYARAQADRGDDR
jgi:hypothetical protein